MTDSRKKLLQLIYEHDQTEGGPLQIGVDGSDIGCDRLTLRNDVSYLKHHDFVCEPIPIAQAYCLMLTEKGELFVESDFQRITEQLEQYRKCFCVCKGFLER